jgi:hypothetical protein
MRRVRRRALLPVAGILYLMLLGLAGCGNQDGEQEDTRRSASRLNLQLLPADSSASRSGRQIGAADTVRRVAPGEPGFITRLDIRIEATDIATPITRSVSPTTAQQQEVSVELLVPVGSNRRIAASAFNASSTEICSARWPERHGTVFRRSP